MESSETGAGGARRLGFVGIIVEHRSATAEAINRTLSEFGERIVVRTGVPNVRGKSAVIMLTVEMTPDELGALTGRLGAFPGVAVRSALAKA
jgi:putative iron-only hydrogenase system regulator